MILLKERIEPEDLQFLKEDVDISGQKEKVYRVKGIMLQSEIRNRNQRIYPKGIMEREVVNFNTKIKNKQGVGTCDHSTEPNIDLDRISHKFESLVMDGNNGIGIAKINNNPCGKILRGLIDDDIVFGMSSRAIGSLTEDNVVKEDLQILSIDAVLNPSAPEAIVESIVEHWEHNGDRWFKVCKDGKCTMKKKSELTTEDIKNMANPVDLAVSNLKESVDRNSSSKNILDSYLAFLGSLN
jgi:hypothetical protein